MGEIISFNTKTKLQEANRSKLFHISLTYIPESAQGHEIISLSILRKKKKDFRSVFLKEQRRTWCLLRKATFNHSNVKTGGILVGG